MTALPPPDLRRAARVALYVLAGAVLAFCCGLAATAGDPPPSVCPICHAAPCMPICPTAPKPVAAAAPAPAAPARTDAAVVLISSDGCPPCVAAESVARELERSGVVVLRWKVPLGSEITPTWAPLARGRSVVGPQSRDKLLRVLGVAVDGGAR